jgi:hypothetical protein
MNSTASQAACPQPERNFRVEQLEAENDELRKRIKQFDHETFRRIDTLDRYDRVYSHLTIIETLCEQPDVKQIASKALKEFAITEHLPAASQAANEMDKLVSENFELRDKAGQSQRISNIQVYLRETAERALLDKSKELDSAKKDLKFCLAHLEHIAYMPCITPKRRCLRRSKDELKYCPSCYAKQVLST